MSTPVGYETRPIARRTTRPLHARRDALHAAANAVFKDVVYDEKKPTNDNENYSRLNDDPHDIIDARRK